MDPLESTAVDAVAAIRTANREASGLHREIRQTLQKRKAGAAGLEGSESPSEEPESRLESLRKDLKYHELRVDMVTSALKVQRQGLAAIGEGLRAIGMMVLQYEEDARKMPEDFAIILARRRRTIHNERTIRSHYELMEKKIAEMTDTLEKTQRGYEEVTEKLKSLEQEEKAKDPDKHPRKRMKLSDGNENA